MTKICSKCNIEKPLTEFSKKSSSPDGLRTYCKQCAVIYNQQRLKDPEKYNKQSTYLKAYRSDPIRKAKMSTYNKEYRKNHYIEYQEYMKKFLQDPSKKKHISERQKKWYTKNKDKIRQYRKTEPFITRRRFRDNARRERIDVRIAQSISRRLRTDIRTMKSGHHWEDIVGYTIHELMNHIQSLFKEGMSWNNYPQWEIDHVKPISKFKFSSFQDSEFKACWSLSNLQPLWADENRKKSSTYSKNI